METVRLVTFRGTKEQVKYQEGASKPFGVFNKGMELKKSCEVEVEDMSRIDLENKTPLKFTYFDSEYNVIPLKFDFDKGKWLLRAYNLEEFTCDNFTLEGIKF